MANARDFWAQFRGLTLENVGSWPIAPRVTVWVAVIVLCAVLGWFLLWSKQVEELDRLRAEETALKEQYKQKLQQAINLEELRKQKEQVSQYVLTLEKQLPSKAEMDALLSDINQAGIGRGLQFELFRPGQVNIKDHYAELPIAVRVSGRYHDLGAFTGDIANLPRIVTLNNLALQAARDGQLTMEATAKTFRYLDEEELAAQRKARQAKQQQAKK
ncbi:MAG: type 4a pilus biogenesis protein PilO [Sutterellaceae bacterium]|nr:type 4a pilus biogenesis protein PilO [Burkholderiaceae bacterium]MCX7901392.1 type 4a pilus biogenesis protein PilO [Burkholderiaceae bacterium]MDW8430112.1 type 4a pilus biogenesis protein PilO [Sutterellaceae bacterium]